MTLSMYIYMYDRIGFISTLALVDVYSEKSHRCLWRGGGAGDVSSFLKKIIDYYNNIYSVISNYNIST